MRTQCSHISATPESPNRHVQSLPRPSNSFRLEVSDQSEFSNNVKRSSSFHVKSHSISSPPTFRKSSLDISPIEVFEENVENVLKSIPTFPPRLSNSSSSFETDEKLEILDSPELRQPVSRNLSNITENRSSTQSAPGNLQSSPESGGKRNSNPEGRISDLSRKTSTSSTSSYSERVRRLRGRGARETEGVIRPGKVAAILHRFSSTNRGSIRSVYYDSNSDGEEDQRIYRHDQSTYRHSKDSDLEEVDHLSVMLDETLEDLDPSG